MRRLASFRLSHHRSSARARAATNQENGPGPGSLKAKALVLIREQGNATLEDLQRLGLTRDYVSQLHSRGFIARSEGNRYYLPTDTPC